MSGIDGELVEAVAGAIKRFYFGGGSEYRETDFAVARAVLSVPAVRGALARDAQVREIVDEGIPSNPMTRDLMLAQRYRTIAALYPEDGAR